MTSAVDIANDACAYLGQNGDITSLDTPTTATSRLMARLYPRARQFCLGVGTPWSFATKVSTSLVDVGTDSDVWAYKYAMPSDVITPIIAYPEEWTKINEGVPFQRIGDYLYTNSETLMLKYVWDNTDTTKWLQPFCDAVAWRLAGLAAGTLIRGIDPKLTLSLMQSATNALALAAERDGWSEQPGTTYTASWIRKRAYNSTQDDD